MVFTYEESRHPRKLSLPKQEEYYQALANFWKSVVNKYPNRYNKGKATIYSSDLKRVQKEMKNE